LRAKRLPYVSFPAQREKISVQHLPLVSPIDEQTSACSLDEEGGSAWRSLATTRHEPCLRQVKMRHNGRVLCWNARHVISKSAINRWVGNDSREPGRCEVFRHARGLHEHKRSTH